MIVNDLKIIENKPLTNDIYKMTFEGDLKALPGQFVNVKINDSSLLLRRPISVFDCTEKSLSIIYRVVGAGTKELSTYKEGSTVSVLGPVGSGFPRVSKKKVLIVGGGIGVPPLYYLAKSLVSDNEITFVLGFRDKSQVILENELSKYGKVIVTTDDGSYGLHGNVIKAIEEYNIDFDVVYACGPSRMLEAIDKKYYGQKEGYISFEERMACGIGICYGCACRPRELKKGMLRVCKEGPVFELGVINYDKA